MTPLKQRFKHDPTNGVWGDCQRAAVASIFDLALNDVPDFGDGGPSSEEFRRRIDAFMERYGLVAVSVPYNCTLEQLLEATALQANNVYFLLGGTSRTGVNQTVVGYNGKIIHDPSLTDAGITGPCDDGYYWIEYFVARHPSALRLAS